MVFKLFRRNPLDSVSIEELKEMEIKLENKIRGVKAEIEEIDREIELVLEDAKKAKTKSDKLSLARRLKTLKQKKEMKLKAQAKIEKELRMVSNLIIVKEYQKDLESTGVWGKLKKMNPEKVEEWLVERNFEEMSRDEMISQVIAMTSSAMDKGIEFEEDLEDELEVIRAIKRGDVDIKDAKREIYLE